MCTVPLQVFNGACNNSVIQGEGYSELANTPPAQFTEKYFQCTMGVQQAIVYSVGVTLQNADAFTNGAFVVIFALMAWYLSNYRNYKNDLIHYKDKDQLDREWKMKCLDIIEALPRNKNANLKLNAKVDRMIAQLSAATLHNATEDELVERQKMRGQASVAAGGNAQIATEVRAYVILLPIHLMLKMGMMIAGCSGTANVLCPYIFVSFSIQSIIEQCEKLFAWSGCRL